MSQNVWVTIMPFGPVTNFLLAQKKLFGHCRWWFSLGTPTSSTTKTGRHDITEILLSESGVKHQKSINQSIFYSQ